MDEKELRKALEIHLDTLRRNLEVVSLEVLKTKYQKPYEELRGQICKAATEYTRHVALCDIRIRRSLFNKAKTYIDAAIQQTQCLKKISEAAFSGRIWMKLQPWPIPYERKLKNLFTISISITCACSLPASASTIPIRSRRFTTRQLLVFGAMVRGC